MTSLRINWFSQELQFILLESGIQKSRSGQMSSLASKPIQQTKLGDIYLVHNTHIYFHFLKISLEFVLIPLVQIQHCRAHSSFLTFLIFNFLIQKPGSHNLQYVDLTVRLVYTHKAVSKQLTLPVTKIYQLRTILLSLT